MSIDPGFLRYVMAEKVDKLEPADKARLLEMVVNDPEWAVELVTENFTEWLIVAAARQHRSIRVTDRPGAIREIVEAIKKLPRASV